MDREDERLVKERHGGQSYLKRESLQNAAREVTANRALEVPMALQDQFELAQALNKTVAELGARLSVVLRCPPVPDPRSTTGPGCVEPDTRTEMGARIVRTSEVLRDALHGAGQLLELLEL